METEMEDRNAREAEISRLQAQMRELESHLPDRDSEYRIAALAMGVASATGPKFFEVLVQQLSQALGCPMASLGVLEPEAPPRARTLAYYKDGAMQEDMVYELAGTPCENVLNKVFCVYPERVQQAFPSDHFLQVLGIHSYAGMPMIDSAGNVLGLISVMGRERLPDARLVEAILRITASRAAAEIERLRIEQQLKRSQEELSQRYAELSSIYHTAPVGLVFYNTDLRITNVNERVCEIDGLPMEAHIGKRLNEIFPKLAVREESCMQRVLDTGVPIIDEEIETPDTHVGGRPFVLSRSVVPQKGADGQIIGLNVVFIDITQQKRQEAALRLHDHAMQSAVGGIVLAEMDGTITWINPALTTMTGYSQADLVGTRGHFVAREPDKIDDARRQLLESGAWSGEIRLRRKDGQDIDLLVHSSVAHDVAGKPICTMSWCEDISDRKQSEREREHLIAQLEAKNAELERFTYTVSHDLKSPLVTISGFIGMLEHDLASGNKESVREDLTEISFAAARMKQLLDDLLQLSRVGRVMNPPQTVALKEIADQVVQALGTVIAEAGTEVVICDHLPAVHGDRGRLLEVLQNLVDNAIKFSRHKEFPRIEIGVQETPGSKVVYVRDNGIGIDAKYATKIFGLFEQLNPEAGGTGIGLAIAKRIIEVHGGSIWAESAGAGQGATFCFTLPDSHAGEPTAA